MNFGEIKAFLGDQPPAAKPSQALNKELQAEGLKQAANFQAQQVANTSAASVSVLSSQTTVGLKIYSGSMQQNVEVNGEKAPADKAAEKDKPATLFDFEKVAENVMRFVGGVIRGASASGADEEKLASLFQQARSGVAKGISMAERDIGGLMNDDISQGIAQSRSLLNTQIAKLENALLGKSEETVEQAVDSLSAKYAEENSGDLKIRTKDGDEIKLEFLDLRQVSFSTQSIQSQLTEANADSQTKTEEQSLFKTVEFSGFRISVKGELDDEELASIGQLVSDANDLADTFYRGDIETAFNQALELGYDKQELVGYALQLNRVEKAEVVKAYGYVQHYNDQTEAKNDQDNAVQPVAQYLDKMIAVLEQSRQNLESGDDYNTLVNGIINEMKDVQVPDLVQAINRFHTFNQQLLDNLPKAEQPIADQTTA